MSTELEQIQAEIKRRELEAIQAEIASRQTPEDYGTEPLKNRHGAYAIGQDSPLGLVSDAVTGLAGQREALLANLSGTAATPYSQIGGGIQAVLNPNDPLAGPQARDRIAESLTVAPETAEGQRIVQGQAELMEPVSEAIEAARLGDEALEAGYPEWLARMAEAMPEYAGMLLASLGLKQPKTTSTIKTTVPGKGKKRIPVEFKDVPEQPKWKPGGRIEPSIDDAAQMKMALKKGTADPRTAQYKLDPSGTVVKDPLAVAASRTGWNDNVIQITKTAAKSPADRIKGLEMVQKARDGIKDLKYGASTRPDSVLGDSVMARFKILKREMLSAGTRLDDVARKAFKGKKIDSTRIMSRLEKKITEWGGVMDDKGRFKFPAGTELYDLPAGQKLLNSIYRQAKTLGDSPSGYQLHKFKQWVDTKIKTASMKQEGLVGAPDRFIAGWRENINKLLRSASDDYKKVNMQYSETKSAIDGLADAFGAKRLYGDGATEATGQIMRKWISRAPNRQNLISAVTEADRVAAKYGGVFDDTMESQVLMANMLDDLITKANPLSRGTFKADIVASRQPLTDRLIQETANKVVAPVAEKFGYTDDPLKALDAIEDLLRSPGG